MSVIPKGSRVLVTGANGYLGSQVVNYLLSGGYSVRGTIRDEGKGAWMKDYFGTRFGSDKLDLVVVPDMAAKGAYDMAVKGVSGVVHTASNLTFGPDPNKVIPETIDGTLEALKSATSEPGVRRFVLTSSSAAAAWPQPNKQFTVNKDDWNNGAVERAWAPPPYEGDRVWDVYGASKVESEQALWKFVKDKKPHFVTNAVVPNTIFGPGLVPAKQNMSTGGFIAGIYENGLDFVKGIPPQYHIDVRDLARLHVAALTEEDVKDERIFAYAEPYNWNAVLSILRKASPKHKFPDNLPDDSKDVSIITERPRAEALLKRTNGGHGFTSLEDTIRANVAHITV